MIYVDEPKYARRNVKKPRKFYAHMIADSMEQLHQFAESLNIKKYFFHNHKGCPHYDIDEVQWLKARCLQAKYVTTKELLKIAKENNHGMV